jgi:hypothetical protein
MLPVQIKWIFIAFTSIGSHEDSSPSAGPAQNVDLDHITLKGQDACENLVACCQRGP